MSLNPSAKAFQPGASSSSAAANATSSPAGGNAAVYQPPARGGAPPPMHSANLSFPGQHHHHHHHHHHGGNMVPPNTAGHGASSFYPTGGGGGGGGGSNRFPHPVTNTGGHHHHHHSHHHFAQQPHQPSQGGYPVGGAAPMPHHHHPHMAPNAGGVAGFNNQPPNLAPNSPTGENGRFPQNSRGGGGVPVGGGGNNNNRPGRMNNSGGMPFNNNAGGGGGNFMPHHGMHHHHHHHNMAAGGMSHHHLQQHGAGGFMPQPGFVPPHGGMPHHGGGMHGGGMYPHHHHHHHHHHAHNALHHHQHHHMMMHQPMQTRPPRKAVVVLGAPKSGKTTLAKRIHEENAKTSFLVAAPLDKEKFDELGDELKKVAPNDDRMLVLDGFGADHDADLFYLSNVLVKHNYAVYGLVYLNLQKPAKTIAMRQDDVPPTTAQMFGHAVAFETCAAYDGAPGKNLILIDADGTRNDVYNEFVAGWKDAQEQPLRIEAPKVLKCIDRSNTWKMEMYSDFKLVTAALQKALPPAAMNNGGSSPQPLRSAYGPLTYSQFSRWFSRLFNYHVSLMTNGQRVVLFAFNGNLYFLPEHGYYVFRFDPAAAQQQMLMPGQVTAAVNGPQSELARVQQWFTEEGLALPDGAANKTALETQVPLVFDAEYVIFQGDEYMLLRDVLVFAGRGMWNQPLKERLSKMSLAHRPRQAQDEHLPIQILPHRYTAVEKVSEIFTVWTRAETSEESQPVNKVGVGVRMEPPGGYPVGTHDNNLLYWFDPERIAVVVRLWHVEDEAEGQRFVTMAVDDSTGMEGRLPKECPNTVYIPSDLIAEDQLGEGHIVEVGIRRQAPMPAPASRGGKPRSGAPAAASQQEQYVFEFVRRRWDIAVPMYFSTIASIVAQSKHAWSKQTFQHSCELLSRPDDGAAAPASSQ